MRQAYIGRPLLKNLLAFRLPRSDRDLFFGALLSLPWIGAIAYTMFSRGLSTASSLIGRA